ncbi:hypothetical protein [Pseudarthrobacter phenanthrenivorans]|uniref:hypothetical protein n=1 Tax=Pseudarthrobacter phenanthrenivorans TaxID=361575 RepID=UPI002F35455C
MGLTSWLREAFGRKGLEAAGSPDPRTYGHSQPSITRTLTISYSACVEVAGTTTFAKDAVAALADRRGLGGRGYFVGQAQLQREPENPVDPQAVAVLVDGERVGCLPSYASEDVHLPVGVSHPVPYQLHILHEDKLRAKAFVWLGDGDPEWAYTAQNPPALAPTERVNDSHAAKSAMVREALAEGGARAEQFRRGMVDGVHYLELIEPIKQLKRGGRLEEALVLYYKAIAGAEGDAQGGVPAPWYTEQAAIVHRKLGQRDEEIAVLERWLQQYPEERRAGSRIGERLAKLEAR